MRAWMRWAAPAAVCGLVGCIVVRTTPSVEPAAAGAAGGPTTAAAADGRAAPSATDRRPAAGPMPRVGRTVAWSISSWSPRASWTLGVGSSPAPAWRRSLGSPGASWLLGSHSPDASWSWDGTRVAYYDGDCVSVRRADGNFERALHATGVPPDDRREACRSPRWSHDGRTIVTSHAFHGPGLLFDVAGGSARALRPRGDGLWGLSFVPGDRMVIGRVHQTGVVLVPVDAPDRVFALVTDEDPALGGYFPSVSPDGRWAVRYRGDPFAKGDRAALEILALDLERPRHASVRDPWDYKKKGPYEGIFARHAAWVESGRTVAIEHAWAADGKRLVIVEGRWYPGYDAYDYGDGALVVVDLPSGRRRPLGLNGRNPTWSPDGRFIAFDRGAGGGLWVVGASGRGERMLLADGIEPRWSPDGRRILYQDPWDRVLAVAELE